MKLGDIEKYLSDVTVFSRYDLEVLVFKLLAVVKVASLAPIREHWSEELCNRQETDELMNAVIMLQKALDNLEDD